MCAYIKYIVMSVALLERLKHRPIPIKHAAAAVDVVIPVPEKKAPVVLQTQVIDKTRESIIDRSEIIAKIKGLQIVSSSISTTSPADVKLGSLEVPRNAAIEAEAAEEKQRSRENVIVIKKLTRRIKLVERPIEKMTPASAAIAVSEMENKRASVIEPGKKPRRQLRENPDTTTAIKTIRKLKLKEVPSSPNVISEGPATMVKIGDTQLIDRLPSKMLSKDVSVLASSYYMNNREKFSEFINALFQPYRDQLLTSESDISCDRGDTDERPLFAHQKIVRDYLDIHTPYRGLLLFHGLGSGKTCASIAIAEGLKTYKQIIVMTPASLRMNYVEELKKCGDAMYKKNQFWEFIECRRGNTELAATLSKVLMIPVEFIRKNGGAWMVNVKKSSNYDELTPGEKVTLDNQLNEMIRSKYRFINYNGMRAEHLKVMSNNYTENPFDNTVVIVDEAHNFVSRIVNKLNRPGTLAIRIYEYLLSAQNMKIVLMTGTPIINYPNEIGILFNLLRGYIKTWMIPLKPGANFPAKVKLDMEYIQKGFNKTGAATMFDTMEYNASLKMLTITRNPFGFHNVVSDNKYRGVTSQQLDIATEGGLMSDAAFEKMVVNGLKDLEIDVNAALIKMENFKALPDTLESFNDLFVNGDRVTFKNQDLFIRRILGLTSYFRSAQEKLLPAYDPITSFHLVEVEMSDFQHSVYTLIRAVELKQEEDAKKKQRKNKGARPAAAPGENAATKIYEEFVSTYRIFSRAFCNFVFPNAIKRPLPTDDKESTTAAAADEANATTQLADRVDDILKNNSVVVDEDALDAVTIDEHLQNPDGLYDEDDRVGVEKGAKERTAAYHAAIVRAMDALKTSALSYLTPQDLATYSPKFLYLLQNVLSPDNRGLHLIYSQFRTLEGIGILKLVLETNGFSQFKIKQMQTGDWVVDMADEDLGRPCFALYTGTESPEEKEIIRNIYNNQWKYVPRTIVDRISAMSSGNMYGEIIKVLMITASGAEGINLRNVRFIHIVEPYWHPVRTEQIIGRGRRICSHKDLPEEMRTVDVYMYLMKFSEKQLKLDDADSQKVYNSDISRLDRVTVLTTDQSLYEIAKVKEDINKQILNAVKASAFDCALHTRAGAKGQVQCFTFGKVTSDAKLAFSPNIALEEGDAAAKINKEQRKVNAVEVSVRGTKYAFDKSTNTLYDLENYKSGNLIVVGKLVIESASEEKGTPAVYRIEHARDM